MGLGASTKGNIILQHFGLTKEKIPYISERNPEKVGLRCLGSDIELISEKKAEEINPEAFIVLPWNFKKEIVERERKYLDGGGKLMFVMPFPHVVTKDGEVVIVDQFTGHHNRTVGLTAHSLGRLVIHFDNLIGGDNQYGRSQKFVPKPDADAELLIEPPWYQR